MKIECLQQKKEIDKKEILASFLRTIVAVARYGRTTIYEGDTYYVPYTIVSYQVEETKEIYRFITSEVSEDVAVFRQDEKKVIEMVETEADERYVVEGVRGNEELLKEVDPLLQKVDFKNLSAVEERFAKNYMQSAVKLLYTDKSKI